jgi:hypothetical protein
MYLRRTRRALAEGREGVSKKRLSELTCVGSERGRAVVTVGSWFQKVWAGCVTPYLIIPVSKGLGGVCDTVPDHTGFKGSGRGV